MLIQNGRDRYALLKNQLAKTISLEGAWEFSLGAQPNWGQVQVPGCWEAQGYSKYLDGPAHLRRSVNIPADWAGEVIVLEFAAVSYACEVRVNGTNVGGHQGLWTPFSLDVSRAVRCGAANQIELEVYKPGQRYPMRSCLAGFLPDVATSFGGIWQPARLLAMSVGLEGLLVDPDPDSGQVRVRCQAVGLPQPAGSFVWRVSLFSGESPLTSQEFPLSGDGQSQRGCLDAVLSVPSFKRWSPESPALYDLRVEFIQDSRPAAQVSQRFGFRRLEARGNLIFLNGEPLLLRGVLSWGWNPERIAPAYTPELARDEIRRVKALGFNLIKLCLFVPDQTYFEIADEEGMLLWEEMPLWLPVVSDDLRARAPGEYTDIVHLTRSHPSVAVYSLGCELSRSVDAGLLEQLNRAVRALVSDVLVCDNSGSGESYGGFDFDFADFTDYHPYYDLHFFEPLLDNWRRDWLPARPWIFGEFSDSDGYRDLAELKAANAGRRPWWLTEDNPGSSWRPELRGLAQLEERLAKVERQFSAPELVKIAAAQSLTARKYTLEALRRRAGMGGYVITGLRDTPIATSGVFDDFDRPKWPAQAMRDFNDQAILCLDTDRRRRWTYGGDRPDRLDVYNHWGGPDSTANWHIILSAFAVPARISGKITWHLTNLAGDVIDSGQLLVDKPIQPGVPAELAVLSCDLPVVARAAQFLLQVSLVLPGQEVKNNWPIWIYPPVKWPQGIGIYDPSHAFDKLDDLLSQSRRLDGETNWEEGLVLASAWSERLDAHLQAGRRVLLLQQGDGPLPSRRGPFWREGLKLFPPHPIWELFPQQGFADMQFFGLAGDGILDASRLAEFLKESSDIRPILQRLDEREFFLEDYVMEAKVGPGKLLACSLAIQGGAGAQPAGLQHNVAGSYLLWAMITYLSSNEQ